MGETRIKIRLMDDDRIIADWENDSPSIAFVIEPHYDGGAGLDMISFDLTKKHVKKLHEILNKMYGDLFGHAEIDKITKKINKFSCDWDSGEHTDNEWEELRLKQSRKLAIEILKYVSFKGT